MMKRLIWIVILMLLTIPSIAQSMPDDASILFEALAVDNVRLDLSATNEMILLFNGSPAVCDDLLVDIAVDEQFIDINAFVPTSDAVCNTIASYEARITLPDLDTEQSYILSVNDFVTTFYLESTNANSSSEPFAVLWGETYDLIAFNAVAPFIESVDFKGLFGNRRVTISGNHPDGCMTETYTRLRQDNIQANLYHAEIFRLVPPSVMCPAELVPFEATIDINLSGGDIIEANGTYARYENSGLTPVNAVPVTIDSVEILDTANNAIVVITGADCGFDITESLIMREYVTLMSLVAYPRQNDSCNEDSVYEQTVTVDQLPILINGIGYDENGIIEPIARSQSTNQAGEGNFMTVETVIESVEVIVLESFPMQLQLVVVGYQPDGCDLPVQVEQVVRGDTVTLQIYRDVPTDVMCPMVLNPYEETIIIDGTFEGGTITIEVNGFTTDIDL